MLVSISLQKHIFYGCGAKSTKTASKVNGINTYGASNDGFDSHRLQPVIRGKSEPVIYPALLTTTSHAFGPPGLKLMSFKSGRTSNLLGSMDSIFQPSA